MRLIKHDYFITVEMPAKGGRLSTVFRLGAVPIGKDTTALDRAVRALFGRGAKAVKIEPVTKKPAKLSKPAKAYALYYNDAMTVSYKVNVMALFGLWAMVRRKGAMPRVAHRDNLCHLPKDYNGP